MVAVQRDCAESLQQLSLFPDGREALLAKEPLSLSSSGGYVVKIQPVVEALEALSEQAMSQEAKECAAGALMALGVHTPEKHNSGVEVPKHIMLSYQWSHQDVVQRVHDDLICQGYSTWYDLVNMKGSTADAMSAAIDNADVMCYDVSLACKYLPRCNRPILRSRASENFLLKFWILLSILCCPIR
jgi:hypothetical protein|eukprot:COSAG02_NODE_3989_length_5943_cov_5.761636_6_plen_186_part_00